MNAETILKSKLPSDIVDALLHAYKEIESNFVMRRWKTSELDAGHFVEAARRAIEFALFGKFTPIGKALPNFNDKELARYESSVGDETYRIHTPRILKAIYNIRNKRGVGHLSHISANEMDATLILYSVKWVLAEFVRVNSGTNTTEAQKIIDQIVERRLSILWKNNATTRVIVSGVAAKDQVLILLYDQDPQSLDALQKNVEYKNKSEFKRLLIKLHKDRFLEMSPDNQCSITPNGMLRAEALLLDLASKAKK
ncbi:hypothetical protein [Ferrovibrio sp.]|uniref:hypothetical protein n=1 Tax=Ferrovibrio sp. TaxID=1917215 RepID=UPI003D138C8A